MRQKQIDSPAVAFHGVAPASIPSGARSSSIPRTLAEHLALSASLVFNVLPALWLWLSDALRFRVQCH